MAKTNKSQAGPRPDERRPSNVGSRAGGSDTATTFQEQLEKLQTAWEKVNGATDEMGNLLSLTTRAEMAVREAGLAHTPQRALQLLDIRSEPRPVGPITPGGPGFIYS